MNGAHGVYRRWCMDTCACECVQPFDASISRTKYVCTALEGAERGRTASYIFELLRRQKNCFEDNRPEERN